MLPIDELIKKSENRYYLTTLVARRSKQLNQGARPLVEIKFPVKPLFLALEEIRQEKLKWKKITL